MMPERILFVDDDPAVLGMYRRTLANVIQVETAPGGEEGLAALTEQGPFAVIVADMHMPRMDGIQFLVRARALAPNIVPMLITGNADLDTAIKAVNEGNVFRFLTKPCPAAVLGKALVDGIRQYRLLRAEEELLEGTLNGTVELLAEILSCADPEAFGRTIQARRLVQALAHKLAIPNGLEAHLAATLSQIGHIAIPRDVLLKTRAGADLEYEERVMIESIPQTSHDLLVKIPRLENVARAVLFQNKRFDGKGYPPDPIAGGHIPIAARILKVVLDLIDLETQGYSPRLALREMRRRESWYDPEVLYAAVELFSHGVENEPELAPPATPMTLDELRPGLMLEQDLSTRTGRLLVRRGAILTETLLLRVKKFATLFGIHEPILTRPSQHYE